MSDAPPEAADKPAQKEQPCNVCGKPIPVGIGFCNNCKSYQDWRRHIPGSQVPLTLLTTLIAVITPAIAVMSWVLHYDSATSAVFVSASRDKILVYVWNTGRNPSAVLKTRLLYTGASLQDADLDAATWAQLLIEPNGHSILDLTIQEPRMKPPVYECKCASARVEVDVQESDGSRSRHEIPLPADFVCDQVQRLTNSQNPR